MSFEEEFPSLEGKHYFAGHMEVYSIPQLQKHCLDKQKVKKAIITSLKTGFGEEWIGSSLETTNEVQLLASLIMRELRL